MRTPLDNLAAVHHQDLIGCQYRAQSMSDNDAGAPCHHPF
jgi:hypothetical protein